MNNKYKILLVEDDENIRIMVGAMLESAGYQVIETGSCATAITLTSSHIPDLIVLDLGLPDMDGMELLETVRKTDLIPIIVLSARVDEPEKVKAFDLGANDYITKPFGTNKNARRAAMVHLSFNVIGTAVWLSAFAAVDALASPALFDAAASHAGIATAHSLFNIACTVLLLPASALLEKLAYTLVPETEEKSRITMLDERLLEGREHRLHTHEGTADHGKIYQMHYDLFLKEFRS